MIDLLVIVVPDAAGSNPPASKAPTPQLLPSHLLDVYCQHLGSCVSHIELFAPEEVAIVHAMNRVVRRCFLLGDDPVSGNNYDHRKVWIEVQLCLLAAQFGIDLLGFTILSNHFHLILRSRPDCVAQWADTEVARRWLMLCPVRKDHKGRAEEPDEMELNAIRNDPDRLTGIRSRLSDTSWWMRLLC